MCPTTSYSPPTDFRAAFDVLDCDRDGKISPDDLRAFYAGLGPGAAEEDREEIVEEMIAAADANKDGLVEYEDFERLLEGASSSLEAAVAGVAEDMFRLMDRDGDGRVGFDDLKAYMSLAGLYASDDDVRAMIMICGGGGDGRGVCCESLLKMILSF